MQNQEKTASSISINVLTRQAIVAAINGGEKIREVYNRPDFEVEIKSDNSPLTIADKMAHLAIKEELDKTQIPVLSEEGKDIPYSERKNWEYLWIVDPLDGTKEFIKRNGEFTVNIALIQNGLPILGVIYVPVKNVIYYGSQKEGAFKAENIVTAADQINAVKITSSSEIRNLKSTIRVVGSRSHMSPETEAFVAELRQQYGEVEMVSMGSSLKICLVAEGSADIYPRFAPTMEWDTAAGQAIAMAAGKNVMDYSTGETMRYNKEDLLNNWFIVK
jgi:3'(2'), 5'-bisphosphate nucleotidase